MKMLAHLMSAAERAACVVGALTELTWTAIAAARLTLRGRNRP